MAEASEGLIGALIGALLTLAGVRGVRARKAGGEDPAGAAAAAAALQLRPVLPERMPEHWLDEVRREAHMAVSEVLGEMRLETRLALVEQGQTSMRLEMAGVRDDVQALSRRVDEQTGALRDLPGQLASAVASVVSGQLASAVASAVATELARRDTRLA